MVTPENGFSLVLPVYNEELSVGQVVENLLEILKKIEMQTELVVVNDGSEDGTNAVLSSFNSRIRLIDHSCNRGYGAALKTGINQSKFDWVGIIDADNTYPQDQLPHLVKTLEQGWDMVVGARTGSHVRIQNLRRPAKWVLTKFASYLADYNIPDLNSGLRVFRKSVVKKYFHILPNKFSFTSTITLALISDGYGIAFEPIDYFERVGKSKIKPRDALNFLILVVRTITYFNPLRFFLPLSLIIFIFGTLRLGYDVFLIQNITDSTTLLFLFAFQTGLIGILADLIVKRTTVFRDDPRNHD